MSVVAAIALPGRSTVIGCDQRAWELMVPTKWARKGEWAIGVSGVYRVLPLICAATESPPDDPLGVGIWLRKLLIEDGFKPGENEDNEGGPRTFPFSALLASSGKLWYMDSSMTPFAVRPHTLMAVGSGREYARGAAHMLRHGDPESMVRAAVQTAIDLDYEHCGGDPVVEWL